MIDKILSSIGLVRISLVRDLHKEPFTDDELNEFAMSKIIVEDTFDRDKLDEMMGLLAKNPLFTEYCTWTIKEDMLRAFNVTESERAVVRGAVTRTRYFKSLAANKVNTTQSLRNKSTRYLK